MAPPRQLGARIRWLFLILILFHVTTAVPRILTGDGPAPLWRVAAVSAALALGSWWLHGYRRAGFPVWAAPVEGLLLGLVGFGSHNWLITLGLLFVTVAFRGLYGTWRHALLLTASLFAGSVGAIVLTDPDQLGVFLQQAAGAPPLALFTALVAESTRRQERATARERVFARLGSTLVTTSERETVCRLSTEAARDLLGGLPGGWAAVTGNTPDGEVVRTVAGPAPDSLLAGDIAAVRVTVTLRSDKHLYGTLMAGGDAPIPAEVLPALEALAAQTVLGLRHVDNDADLRHQAFHDSLTGLANRALLRDRLQQAVARADRDTPVALLLFELSGFKAVNDRFGHTTGDQLLVAVAQRLRDGIRGADTAARLGGDEFAVLLDGMDSPEDAGLVAGRLLAAVQEPFRVSRTELLPRAAVGVAVWDGHPDADALLNEAAGALHERPVAA